MFTTFHVVGFRPQSRNTRVKKQMVVLRETPQDSMTQAEHLFAAPTEMPMKRPTAFSLVFD
jgi:hypothetical protein